MTHRPRQPLLTDRQWKRIEPLLPALPKSKKGGRPWASNRAVLEGILWILRTGARWQDLPDRYPSPSTCWRRLQRWEEEDTWLEIGRAFLATLDERKRLDWREAFADATFIPAQKGGQAWAHLPWRAVPGKLSEARAQSVWWWSTARVFLWESAWTRPPRRK
jgi:transposase